MLADPITGVEGSFSKISEDAQSGSVYTYPYLGVSITVTVKHTTPAIGKNGVSRHLVSVTFPNANDDGTTTTFAGTYCTVNLTITNTTAIPATNPGNVAALLELLKFISNGTSISTFGQAVLNGAF
jgi:hypothetical protein